MCLPAYASQFICLDVCALHVDVNSLFHYDKLISTFPERQREKNRCSIVDEPATVHKEGVRAISLPRTMHKFI